MRGGVMALLLGVTACGRTHSIPTDAGEEYGLTDPDGSVPPADAAPRLLPHADVVLSAMKVGIVYVGEEDAGGPPTNTTSAPILGSTYWLLLNEYGVGPGTIVGSTRAPISTLLRPSDMDDGGLVDMLVLQARVAEFIHGDVEAGTHGNPINGAEAYLFFLPNGVNVALARAGSYTYQTCIDADGYHSFDGLEPYAILPPCALGRSSYTTSHELAELATDPQPYMGWASDTDIAVNGGEVADLCSQQVDAGGLEVTRLWSNQSGGCVP
jgi:hypothetical protein